MSWRRLTSGVLIGVGLALAVSLLAIAGPRRIMALAASADPGRTALAFGLTVAVFALRGLRLALVARPRIGMLRATAVTAGTQMAMAVLPMRLGELALLPLLQRAGVSRAARGVSAILALRFFDLTSLAVWTVVAGTAVGLRGSWAVAIVVASLVAIGAALALERGLVMLARRRRRLAGLVRRLLHRSLEVRGELRRLSQDPGRAAAVAVISLTIWAGVWAITLALLDAMGVTWGAGRVLAAVVGAALGSMLPVSALGTFGSLEAGWSAALAATGVPPSASLPAGFATHVWSVVFTAFLGACGIAFLALVHPRTRDSSSRPAAHVDRRNAAEP